MRLRYSGLKGSLNLNEDGIVLLQGEDFFTTRYAVESIPNGTGIGSYFDRVTLNTRTYKFSLFVSDPLKMRLINDYFTSDINAGTPAKLYVNESYIECFITDMNHSAPNMYKEGEIIEYLVTCLTPLWIKEERYEFVKQSGDLEGGLKLPFSFPFSFKLSSTSQAINNKNTSSSKAELIFYGPFMEVDIGIGNCRYKVEAELLENERLIINQRDNTITKVTMSGDRINMFNYRNKEESVFKPIPPGEHVVSANMEYSFEIVVFGERGMPEWTSYMREKPMES